MGILNSARQNKLGRLTTAISTNMISTDSMIVIQLIQTVATQVQILMEKFKQKIAQRRQKGRRVSDRYEGITLKPLYDNISRELQQHLSQVIYKTITEEIPNSLLRSQIIKQKEQFKDEEFLQFAVTELHYQLDKFETELGFIEGNPDQMLEIQKFLAETERRNQQIVQNTFDAAQGLATEARQLALQRRWAKFEDEFLQFQIKIKDYPTPLMNPQKIKETAYIFESALKDVEERNRRDLTKMECFFKQRGNF